MALTLGQGRGGGQGPAWPGNVNSSARALRSIRLPSPGPDVVVRTTDEGAILVDDMFEAHYDHIVALVKTVTPRAVKYVINTHHHGDHTGGNVKFLQHAQILGHKNARAAMLRSASLPGPPPITYTTEAAVPAWAAFEDNCTTWAAATRTAIPSSTFPTSGSWRPAIFYFRDRPRAG